ncbi:MAG: hypothetical protein ACK4PI_03620 [Tepidisphaerales bacterium]
MIDKVFGPQPKAASLSEAANAFYLEPTEPNATALLERLGYEGHGRRSAEEFLEQLRSLADTRRYMATRVPVPPDPAIVKRFEKAKAALEAAQKAYDEVAFQLHAHDRAEMHAATQHDFARISHVDSVKDFLRKHPAIRALGEINLEPQRPAPLPPLRQDLAAALDDKPLVYV